MNGLYVYSLILLVYNVVQAFLYYLVFFVTILPTPVPYLKTRHTILTAYKDTYVNDKRFHLLLDSFSIIPLTKPFPSSTHPSIHTIPHTTNGGANEPVVLCKVLG